jgi:transcriptional regulator with XRE-family HTH domain
MQSALQPVARNLRRWRLIRNMTLSGLAERASVAKSTVSLLERGQGNPSIDTLWALAMALGVPFSSLFRDDDIPDDDVSVVREVDGTLVAIDQAGLDDDGLVIRHMLTRVSAALIEIYTLTLKPGAVRHAEGHVAGLYEHITVATGTVEISSVGFNEIVTQGDLISFRADRPHTYRVIEGPVRLVSVHEYPQQPGATN